MPSKGRRPAAAEPVLRTFLFSDIVGSTAIRDAYVRRHGKVQGNARYRREVLEPHDRRLQEQVERLVTPPEALSLLPRGPGR